MCPFQLRHPWIFWFCDFRQFWPQDSSGFPLSDREYLIVISLLQQDSQFPRTSQPSCHVHGPLCSEMLGPQNHRFSLCLTLFSPLFFSVSKDKEQNASVQVAFLSKATQVTFQSSVCGSLAIFPPSTWGAHNSVTSPPSDPQRPRAAGRALPLLQMRELRLRELAGLVLGHSSIKTGRQLCDTSQTCRPYNLQRPFTCHLTRSLARPLRGETGQLLLFPMDRRDNQGLRMRHISHGAQREASVKFAKHLSSTCDVSAPFLGLAEQKRTRQGSLPLRS